MISGILRSAAKVLSFVPEHSGNEQADQHFESNGAPDRIRTCDLCLRRAALYPAELRVLLKDEDI
jgi:hypothetical protein